MNTKINPPQLMEKLISSLQAVNPSGQLNYLINLLNKREMAHEAEVYVFILLCAISYPRIRAHVQWPNLENLWLDCYSNSNPPDIMEVLDRPENTPVKTFFRDFIQFTLEEEKAHKLEKPTVKKHRK